MREPGSWSGGRETRAYTQVLGESVWSRMEFTDLALAKSCLCAADFGRWSPGGCPLCRAGVIAFLGGVTDKMRVSLWTKAFLNIACRGASCPAAFCLSGFGLWLAVPLPHRPAVSQAGRTVAVPLVQFWLGSSSPRAEPGQNVWFSGERH